MLIWVRKLNKLYFFLDYFSGLCYKFECSKTSFFVKGGVDLISYLSDNLGRGVGHFLAKNMYALLLMLGLNSEALNYFPMHENWKLTNKKVMFCEMFLSLAFKWSVYQSGDAPKQWYFGRNLLNKLSAAAVLNFLLLNSFFFSL